MLDTTTAFVGRIAIAIARIDDLFSFWPHFQPGSEVNIAPTG